MFSLVLVFHRSALCCVKSEKEQIMTQNIFTTALSQGFADTRIDRIAPHVHVIYNIIKYK